jgi:hypothetical protein
MLKLYAFPSAIVILLILLFVTLAFDVAYAETYTFDPGQERYELYSGQLLLWGTGNTTGHETLSELATDYDLATIHAWLGILMASQAMGKSVVVQYDAASGKILSLYGPK